MRIIFEEGIPKHVFFSIKVKIQKLKYFYLPKDLFQFHDSFDSDNSHIKTTPYILVENNNLDIL